MRQKGKTDTEILDYLSSRDYNFGQRVAAVRAKGQTNDRDLINTVAQRISGAAPSVPSVPTVQQKQVATQQKIAEQKKQTIPGTLMTNSSPLLTAAAAATSKYNQSKMGRVNNLASQIESEAKANLEQERQNKIAAQLVKINPMLVNPENLKMASDMSKESPGTQLARTIAYNAMPSMSSVPGEMASLSKAESTILAKEKSAVQAVTKPIVQQTETLGRTVAKPIEKLGEKVYNTVARPQTTEELTAKILQDRSTKLVTKTKNLEQAQNVFARTDLTKVTNFDDAVKEIQKSSDTLKAAKEKFLAQDIRKLNSTATTKIFDGEEINHVKQGLNDLRSAYRTTLDQSGIDFVKEMESKLNSGQLTALDIEKIAQKYGTEYSRRSFSSVSGEPLISYKGTKFETTRTGLKSTARELFPESNFLQTTDKMISENINTANVLKKVQAKIMTIESKAVKEGFWSKYVGGGIKNIVKAVDVVTGNATSKILKEIGLNFLKSNETLNVIQVEQKLNKFLKQLDKINGSRGASFNSELNSFLQKELQSAAKARALENFKSGSQVIKPKQLPAPKIQVEAPKTQAEIAAKTRSQVKAGLKPGFTKTGTAILGGATVAAGLAAQKGIQSESEKKKKALENFKKDQEVKGYADRKIKEINERLSGEFKEGEKNKKVNAEYNLPDQPNRPKVIKDVKGVKVDVNNPDELIKIYEVRPNKYRAIKPTIGKIDLTTDKYATNPKHVDSIKEIYQDVKDATPLAMKKEFERLKSPLTPIAGEITKALKHYGITPGEFLAVIRQDSGAGTVGKGADTKNPGNIGNTDDGSIVQFNTWLEGSIAAIRNLAERKVKA
jgi:hypothetical protein